MDYKHTLCLPQTDFPMKASLSAREPEMLKRWEDGDIYARIMDRSKGREKFILHDGPPYANGHIHLGTALNKILKDIIVKSLFMMGYDTFYRPGWDCHGLPIEHQVEIEVGREAAAKMTKVEIRKRCRAYANKFLDIQREEFKRLGGFGVWQDPYITMDYGYEATIVRELGKFIGNGSIYKARKPVYWCATCGTALAEAEVEYNDQATPAIFVRFKMISDISEKVPELKDVRDDVYMVIWTTTPWTIPANLAIALHPDLEYSAVKTEEYSVLVLATDLVEDVMKQVGVSGFTTLAVFKGSLLEGLKAKHPLYDRESILILAPFVTLEAGSGLVHIAPGHGEEDYEIGKAYGLEVYAPVDNEGKFTKEVEEFAGQFVFDANEGVNKALQRVGALLNVSTYEHSYPYCWRCKNPIIFRSTSQWFISMEKTGLRQKALDEINRVKWIPSWGRDRIYNMVENRPDWCISRQRVWGVPIPVFVCRECGEILMSQEIADRVADIFEKEGSDAWFAHTASELLPPGTTCSACGKGEFTKEEDIVDVWFDSGVSYAAVCEKDPRLDMPVEMYLEGSDQHRGWFHSTLLASVGTRGRAPYKSVLTHGFVVDGEGRKMSKSLGNTISPQEIITKYGAEILRLWTSAQDYRNDIRISDEIVSRLVETYRRIRNTSRFMLGNLHDFDPDRDMVPYEDMLELDRYALHVTMKLIEKVRKAYTDFEPYVIYQQVHNFCVVDMSAFYLDILKDRLYVYKKASLERRSAQSAIFRIIMDLTRLLAPILAFTAEEIWDHMPKFTGKEESVHLTTMPVADPALVNRELEAKWERIIALRQEVSKEMETARRDKVIGHPLDARITLSAEGPTLDFLKGVEPMLEDIFICSGVVVEQGDGNYGASEAFPMMRIAVSKAPGGKCPRCWHYREDIGKTPEFAEVCGRCASQLG
ncbi:MAG TPA: isoleucine--tRNA ligase [Deltaproteobacteria bacterium]|nr:isoleucine--tRNA ligase [Deltaproteobacteria bacterium]